MYTHISITPQISLFLLLFAFLTSPLQAALSQEVNNSSKLLSYTKFYSFFQVYRSYKDKLKDHYSDISFLERFEAASCMTNSLDPKELFDKLASVDITYPELLIGNNNFICFSKEKKENLLVYICMEVSYKPFSADLRQIVLAYIGTKKSAFPSNFEASRKKIEKMYDHFFISTGNIYPDFLANLPSKKVDFPNGKVNACTIHDYFRYLLHDEKPAKWYSRLLSTKPDIPRRFTYEEVVEKRCTSKHIVRMYNEILRFIFFNEHFYKSFFEDKVFRQGVKFFLEPYYESYITPLLPYLREEV